MSVDRRSETTAELDCDMSVWFRNSQGLYQPFRKSQGLEPLDSYLISEFRGISYTWGSAENLQTITINGKTFKVRKNCFYALYQVALHWPYEHFWIDSICINQADNREKSKQVALMGAIFAASLRVCACVGMQDGTSSALMDLLSRLGKRTTLTSDVMWTEKTPRSSRDESQPLAVEHDHQRDYRDRPRRQFKSFTSFQNGPQYTDWLAAHPLVSDSDRTSMLVDFGRREYWKRLWILQELHAGGRKRIDILCGTDSANLEVLLLLNRFLTRLTGRKQREIPYEGSRNIDTIADIVSDNSTKLRFPRDVDMVSDFDCFDVRDRIYGTLSMFEYPPGQPAIVPDYDISSFDLALDLVHRFERNVDDLVYPANILRPLGVNAEDQSFKTWIQAQRDLASDLGSEVRWWQARMYHFPALVYRNVAGELCGDLPQLSLQIGCLVVTYKEPTSDVLPGHWTQIRTGPRSFVLVDAIIEPGDVLLTTIEMEIAVALRRRTERTTYKALDFQVVGRIKRCFSQSIPQINSEWTPCSCYEDLQTDIFFQIPATNLQAMEYNTNSSGPTPQLINDRDVDFPRNGTTIQPRIPCSHSNNGMPLKSFGTIHSSICLTRDNEHSNAVRPLSESQAK